jgi:hypothetical protein
MREEGGISIIFADKPIELNKVIWVDTRKTA